MTQDGNIIKRRGSFLVKRALWLNEQLEEGSGARHQEKL